MENKNIYEPVALKSNLCDFNKAYILVTGNINFVAASIT